MSSKKKCSLCGTIGTNKSSCQLNTKIQNAGAKPKGPNRKFKINIVMETPKVLGVFDFKKEPNIITFSTSGSWESCSTIYFLRFDLVSSFDEIELSKMFRSSCTTAVIALFLNFYLQINTIASCNNKIRKCEISN